MQPDLLIRGGVLHDGLGGSPCRNDIAIKDGRIVEIGRIEAAGADELDADGALVSPGFIDIHSHSDFTLLVEPAAVSALHQGVTCEVIGNCGFGCFPIRDPALSAASIYGFSDRIPLTWTSAAAYLEALEAARPAVNVLTLVPNAQLRMSVLGMSDRAADPPEVEAMIYRLEEALEAGAWGFSTGLEYPAEAAASEEEIVALCACTAKRGGYYATHTRDRDAGAVGAVEEALRTALNAGVRLQVSHLLPRSGEQIGDRCLELVEEAHRCGQDVAFDMHTRLYGTTYLVAALPAWARQGNRQQLEALLTDGSARDRMRTHRSILSGGGDWSRVVLLDNPHWPEYSRQSIAAIADARGQEPFDAVCDLIAGALDDPASLMVIIHAYAERQQHEVFAHPLCMPASDATTLAPFGPLAGSSFHGAYTWAAWFFRSMVTETRRLTAQEAIHRLTGKPAEVLRLSDRGRLAVGARADIAVFEPDLFREQGTTFEPNRLATGMRHVVVNGVAALRDGELTGQRAGQVLRLRGGA